MKVKSTIATFTTLSCIATLLGACAHESPNEKVYSMANEHSKSSTYIAELAVSNPSNFKRTQQPIYVSFYDLGLSSSDQSLSLLQVSHQNTTIESQSIDLDNNGEKDGLLFLTNMNAGQALTFTINKTSETNNHQAVKLTQAEISHKVGGQWITHTKPPAHAKENQFQEYIGGHFENVSELTPPPYYTDHSNWIRYEGPGIESDKVAYRIYLDWRNGFDIFGKKTSAPTLQYIGQD